MLQSTILKINFDILRHGNPDNRGDRRNIIYVTSAIYDTDEYIDVNKKAIQKMRYAHCKVPAIAINNVSNKSMIAVKIIVNYRYFKPSETFQIDLVPKETQLFLISQKILNSQSLDFSTNLENLWDPSKITIFLRVN